MSAEQYDGDEVDEHGLPLDWNLILDELKEEETQEHRPVIAIVIAGYTYKVSTDADVRLLVNALENTELPPSPLPTPTEPDDDWPDEPLVA